MSALPAPQVPLQIEWQPAALEFQKGQTQLIHKPRTALQSYIPGCEPTWQDTDQVTLQDFFAELQRYLKHSLQQQVIKAGNALALIMDEMEDIEWTSPAMPPNFLEDIQRAINEGRLSIASMPTPGPVPNPAPPQNSRASSRAALRTFDQRVNPFAAFPEWSFWAPLAWVRQGLSPECHGGSPPPEPPRRNLQPEGNPGGENQNAEPAGNGGGDGIVPPVGGTPNPGGDSDSSDSEPEDGDRRGWWRYLRKKLEKQKKELLASMPQFMRPLAPSHPSAASRA
ncbi:uncharacterized protein LAJ45_11211 [Morchella importuna]|uniref:uncharacterized protein n=1 Tax=Morchella importuna TaxID=1174673 RepID=UPI001E8CFD3D|nr:uncharacterized protein LAJ45_11211 [Morchella importuna]KAH8144776.1 hypothetical protein LAJ45_11211 [Morchella importuna]